MVCDNRGKWSRDAEEKHLVIMEEGKVTEDCQVFPAALIPCFMVTLSLENPLLPPLARPWRRDGPHPQLPGTLSTWQIPNPRLEPQHRADDMEGREKPEDV